MLIKEKNAGQKVCLGYGSTVQNEINGYLMGNFSISLKAVSVFRTLFRGHFGYGLTFGALLGIAFLLITQRKLRARNSIDTINQISELRIDNSKAICVIFASVSSSKPLVSLTRVHLLFTCNPHF